MYVCRQCPCTSCLSVYKCGFLYVYRTLMSKYNLYIRFCIQVWISVCVQGPWCPSTISISVYQCGYLYVYRGLVSQIQSLYLYTSVDICMYTGVWCASTIFMSDSVHKCGYLYLYRTLVSQYNLYICVQVWTSVCVQGSGVPVQSLYLCTSVDICMYTGVWCASTIFMSDSVHKCGYLYVYRGLVSQYNLYICKQVWISVCVQGSGVQIQSLYLYTSVDICMCIGVWCPSTIFISVYQCRYLYVYRGLVSQYNLYICKQVWISVCVQGSGVPVQSLYLYTSVDICMCTGVWCPDTICISVYQCGYLYVYRGLVSKYNLYICIQVWISVCVQRSGVPVQSLYLCTSVDICMCTGVWCPSTISISVYKCGYLYVYRGLVSWYNLCICKQVWISVCVQGSGVPVQHYICIPVWISVCVQGSGVPVQSLYL